MKLAVLVLLVGFAAANPTERHGDRRILLVSKYFNQDGRGNYEYGYEQSNGQKVDEVGRSYPGPEPGTGSISKEGGFEFVAPNQQKYRVDYRADEGGFQPRGAHLPQPPAQLPEYDLLKQRNPELYIG
ncbi:flexible cuticle protein 12-like [Amphibalanus amphitrite]|uniref:flexible cuticle protein 12-like n=1 Tax=Amphibalanus amphitrite TaxID=1232801 RepID=UPI001C8FC480|nr:flexible cuticle protein 12-like [Amphibalanus amphitrite]XP_043231129.1 flexible cuticle protein 12-like [Amphibalanus amphitrite]